MSSPVNPIEQLSPLKRAVLALERLQVKLDRYKQSASSQEQVKDIFAVYSEIQTLDDQQVLHRLSGFIADHEQLSPLKRAILALERLQERLAQFEQSAYLASKKEDSSADRPSLAGEIDHPLLLPPLQALTPTEGYTLSFEQRRIWFLEQLNPEKALYNEHCVLRIQDELKLEILEQALGTITQRHSILRTSFPVRDGAAIQLIHPWQPVKIVPVDLRQIAASERMSQAIKLAEDDVKHPLDLDKGPLVLFKLYQLAKDDYIFLVVVHHLVADGWSMSIFFRELSTLYTAYCHGKTSPLEDLTLQYADYAVWQDQWLQGEVLNAKLDYWDHLLAGAPHVLALPTDYPRPNLQTYRGAHSSFVLPGRLLADLRKLSQQIGVTLYTVLLGAFQVLLWNYTGQDDLLIGTPLINRNQAELENLIGFFVNTIIVRANLTANPTFIELVKRVSKAVLDAYAQQDVPFDRLLTQLVSQRDLSHSPLFQVVFSMHQASWMKPGLAELTTAPLTLENGRSRVDLTFEIVESDKQVDGLVEYSTDLFNEATIVRLLEHWFTILENVVRAPQQHLSELSLLSQAEREQLLVAWNTTVRDQEVVTIQQVFEQVAIDRSESVAVVFEGRHVTYQELQRRSTQLAAYLSLVGIGPDILVGICVERSVDMLIAVLGVMKAGGAYVPLDPTYPRERLEFLLEDAVLPVLLTQAHLLDRLPTNERQVICLDTEWESTIAVVQDISPLAQISPHNLAYIIYTSGSTGVPKGVMVEHQGLNNLIQAQIQLFGLDTSSHVLQFASFGFDAWISEVFTTLLAGATLYLGVKEALLPDTSLLHTLQYQAITCITLPPSALAVLSVDELPLLQTIVSAGETCSADLVASWAMGRRFLNAYGPTEATVCATTMLCSPGMYHPPIGHPIENVQVYLLNASLQLTPVGVAGELYIGGSGLARGYLHRPDITARSFIPHPFSNLKGARLYKTGDMARYRYDGTLEFLGRVDHQVKVRGFRIELDEIEATLALHPAVRETVVIVREDTPSDKRIVAYIVLKGDMTLSVSEAYAFLKERLPDYLIPSTFVQMPALPLNPHGKMDRQALPAPENSRPALDAEYAAPRTRSERIIAEIWQEVLQIEKVGLDDNFFELGGHSLIMAEMRIKLCELLDTDITIVDLFAYPTINALTEYLHLDEAGNEPPPEQEETQAELENLHIPVLTSSDIAIIGMAGRFPGARDLDEFWHNLQEGREAVSFFTQEELMAAGVEPVLLKDEHYVAAGALLEDVEWFDAAFFGYTPREAEIIDPQQRVFLECAWQALEDAGYNSDSYQGNIAVFGGATNSTYLTSNLLSNAALAGTVNQYQMMLGNSTDFLTTRVSYKLNLRGPGVTVLTACSTSLVAIHLACESLRAGKCDIALAGGVSIRFPQKVGYFYQEGGIMSPDGHCRTFDADAKGIVGGEGVGIIVVKRLADALADGDSIQAVIRGSAMNNDGAQKVGYTAPSVQGQADVIAEALAMSGIDPQTVRYIEAHGTGTPIGDPIEVAALQQVYGPHLPAGHCALGSVKSNIGHLDAAAGVAGLIKTVEALKHHMLPPSLHFTTPNPDLNLERSSFYINAILSPWEAEEVPRRAGVSSFGIGGTNAHVVLEEAPVPEKVSVPTHPWHLVVLSVRTETALQQARANLLQHLRQHPELDMGDVAYTLQVGRRLFAHRNMFVCRDLPDAIQVLDAADPTRLFSTVDADTMRSRPVVFMFPGQGTQYSGMGGELYHTEAVFRAEVDRCAEILLPFLNLDIRSILYPEEADIERTRFQLNQTWLTQPALFVVEYALAKLWLSWGVAPAAMIGHSIGEYVAACLAEVFPLESALKLVTLRGRLMQQLPQGAMLAVSLPLEEIRPLLGERLSIAAINTPEQCVIAGSQEDIERFIQTISEQEVSYMRLHTSHAFHSIMVEPIIKAFVTECSRLQLRPPRLPYISNVSGTWINEAQATDPAYWGLHLRQTVLFANGISQLLHGTGWAFLEVGPGRTLGTFVGQQRPEDGVPAGEQLIAASLPHAKGAQTASDRAFILTTLGRLWLSNVPINWGKLPVRRRIPLPTYPFERQRYWIERHPLAASQLDYSGRDAFYQEELEEVAQSRMPHIATIENVLQDAEFTSSLHARPNLPIAYQAPRNELEQSVTNIWQQFFGISQIGIYDNFFDLGGHSLLAVQILSQLRASLQIDLPLSALFEGGTVADVAQRAEALLQTTVATFEGPDARILPVADAPLSFVQRRFWFLNWLEPGNPVLNIPLALLVQGPLDIALMERCFQEIVRRQSSLRTHFIEVDGEPVQRIVPHLHLPLPMIDLGWLPASEQQKELEHLTTENAKCPFDLSRVPLIRTTVLRLSVTKDSHRISCEEPYHKEHVLLLSMHHSISDGWSMGVFLNEFSALYRAFAHGHTSPLPALPMQYVDFATWQRAQEAKLETHLHYWCTKLAGDLPVLDLPTDYPRPAVPTYRGARQRLHLPDTLLQDLKKLGQREGVTFFMVLLGAFQVLLSRYSGQEDILVSTPVANRNGNDIANMIGAFVDKLILRTDLSGDPSFQSLLGRVRDVCLQGYTHQDVPFEKLVEVLNPQRDTSRSPLTQVLLRLPNPPTAPIEVANLKLKVLPISVETADLDLILDMIELPNGIEAAVEYSTDLFAPSTIERLLQHWQVLLEAVVADPQLHISQLPLLTSAESCTILSEWNSIQVDSPDDRPQFFVHELFEQQARLTPDAIAVSLENAQLSYKELNRRANQLAHYLQTLGVGPEVLVGICMERCLEMVIGMLAIFKAGGAYVPLDPSYPEHRLAFMLDDAQISLLLLLDQSQYILPANITCLKIVVDSDWPQIASQDGEDLGPIGDTSNLAYIIYTSGSTGQPKGVLVSHYGIVNLVEVQANTFGVQPVDHILQFASTSFDASIWEMFMALCKGARLCLASTDRLLPGQTLVDLLCEQQISVITLPPSALTTMAPEVVPALQTIVVAGESCPVDVMRHWAKGKRFFNAYGPTESTICATIAACSEHTTGLPPIGHPVSHTQVYILDTHCGLVPTGIVGQLHIGGKGLARGYLKRTDLTADRFIPHPFSTEPGMRLYKTGDLARYLADGTIEFLGRIDQQVKVRGYRIELGEIEAVLGLHPAVQGCVVVVHEEQLDDKRLVAYVVSQDDTLDIDELRHYLKLRLPEYMLPGVFSVLEALPLTPNGKIDRNALSMLQPAGTIAEDEYPAPHTPIEELLIDICQDILQLERVNIQDNFFEIGGHSLLGAQLISRIRLVLDIDIPIYNLFEAATIAAFCTFVETAFRSKAGVELPPLLSVERQGRIPLSFTQQRMWFLDQLQPGNAFYNVAAPFSIHEFLNVAALEQSLQEVIYRHEILRTTFIVLEEEPCQIIAPSLHIPFPLVDLHGLSNKVIRAELRRQAALSARQPFDLARGPLLRAWLFRMEMKEHMLLLTLHNSISDGWSRGIVMRELTALYQAFQAGEDPELPALPVQYADFAIWQRQWLQGETLAAQTSYWVQHLSHALACLELPMDHPRPSVQTYRGGHQTVSVSISLTRALKDLSQQEGVTLFMTVMATFLVLLSRYSGQEDIVIGTPVASRNLFELENLIGFFANTLALRTDLSGNPTFLELLQRVRKVALGAYTHQDMPFEKLVEIVQPERNLSYSPLFQVMFTLQDELSMARKSNWLAPAELEIDTKTAKFDLNLFLSNGVNGLEGVIEYNADLFESATITNLLQHWTTLLEGIITNPHEHLASLPMLSDEEQQLLLNKLAHARAKEVPHFQWQIAVTATFTADPLQESLAWWINEMDWPAAFLFAPYQQLFQQLLDSGSMLASNHNGINILLIRFEDWLRINDDQPGAKVTLEFLPDSLAQVERNVGDLLQTVQGAAWRNAVPYLLCICPPSPTIQSNKALAEFFQRMENQFSTELHSSDGVYVITSAELNDTYPVDVSYDSVGDEVGHIPYTSAFFAALGTMIVRKISAIYRNPYKVIAVDCDNTLWKGICGEDGGMGVELSAPYLTFQRFLVAQQEAGMLICLCSKNNEEDVLEVFRCREMPLQFEHLVAMRINWQAKSQNLIDLARELQLGIESFVFIDDNPLECVEVQQNCPQVFTLPLPSHVTQWSKLMKHVWIFDHLHLTQEDRTRTTLYQQNIARSQLRQDVSTLKDFLASLELEVQIDPIVEPHVARVAQLTQRTNQFNCTTRRRSANEIIQYQLEPGQEGLVVEARDRFGDYGKVGVMLFALHSESLTVDTFLMSCRSMGRGVEHRMLAYLGMRAQEMGLKRVVVPYQPTGKNKPALDFLEQVGIEFKLAEANGAWCFDFPVASLIDLSYTPPADYHTPREEDEVIEQVALGEASNGSTSHITQLTPQGVLRIANELSSAELVLQAMDHRRKQPASSLIRLVVPRTRTEMLLAEVWQHLLHLEQVSINDSFFALGGHSLLATQLLSRIATVFGIRLPLQAIFERPTIALLGELIEDVLRDKKKTSLSPSSIRPALRDGALPLSFAQQRLWFLDQLASGNSSYNIPLRIRLQGVIDKKALQMSLQEIIQRHEVLRTTFFAIGDDVVQVIAPVLVLNLPVIDLGLLAPSPKEHELQRLLKEEWQSIFSLERGPLLRMMLLKINTEEAILAITVHHIAFDAWSAGVLSGELIVLYNAFRAKKPSPLTPLLIQYADFALWQREWLQGEVLQKLEAYWRERLRGMAMLQLPGELPIKTKHSFRSKNIPFTLSLDLSRALIALSQQEEATLFMTLLATFQTLLYRTTGQTDIAIGTDIANRTLSEVEQMIGFFVNLLVLRTDLSGQPTFRELLKRVRKDVLEAYAHQDLPFEKVVDLLQPERMLSQAPLVRVLFVLQNTPTVPITLPALSISPVEMEVDTVNFDLVIFMYEEPQGLKGMLHYSADVFNVSAIELLVEHFLVLLNDIVQHSDTSVDTLTMASEEELEQKMQEESARQEEQRRKLKILRRKKI